MSDPFLVLSCIVFSVFYRRILVRLLSFCFNLSSKMITDYI